MNTKEKLLIVEDDPEISQQLKWALASVIGSSPITLTIYPSKKSSPSLVDPFYYAGRLRDCAANNYQQELVRDKRNPHVQAFL